MGDEIETRSVIGNDEIERASWVTMKGRRDRSWVTTTPMILVSGGSVFDGDAILMGCDRSRVMRSSVDRYGVMRSSVDWFGWIGLRW